MNPKVPVPAITELKLTRKSTAPAADELSKREAELLEERRRLTEESAALAERETNLREYEARLRVLQSELDLKGAARPGTTAPFRRTTSQAPFEDPAALQAAWEKLHRARELLEAEVAHMRDDRLKLGEESAALKQREIAVSAREARAADREQKIAAYTATQTVVIPPEQPPEESAVTRLTKAPFHFARSVFKKSE